MRGSVAGAHRVAIRAPKSSNKSSLAWHYTFRFSHPKTQVLCGFLKRPNAPSVKDGSKDGSGGKWGSYGAQRPIFGSYPYPPNFLFKNVHEYILIFAKPALTKTKGPKVKQYGELMSSMERAAAVAPFSIMTG
jgi:hypothetical protein